MYEYDLFVSYKRESPQRQLYTPWLIAVLQRVEYYLCQELGGRDVSIFFDAASIDVGRRWPQRLRTALQRSRCLLAIWTPEYFRSGWCTAEWRSFLERERLLREQTGADAELILPVAVHDGRWYPAQAQEVQQFDLSRFFATTPAFWVSARADELDQKIQNELVPAMARAIERSPPFQPGWPLAEPSPSDPPEGTEMIRL
jgi:hypothetical protein